MAIGKLVWKHRPVNLSSCTKGDVACEDVTGCTPPPPPPRPWELCNCPPILRITVHYVGANPCCSIDGVFDVPFITCGSGFGFGPLWALSFPPCALTDPDTAGISVHKTIYFTEFDITGLGSYEAILDWRFVLPSVFDRNVSAYYNCTAGSGRCQIPGPPGSGWIPGTRTGVYVPRGGIGPDNPCGISSDTIPPTIIVEYP
jgi:hypothetical protein